METKEPTPLVQTHIPTELAGIQVNVIAGTPVFILGRNGTGKSALVNLLAAQWRGLIVYMPGSRPSYFDNESLSMTPATRRDFSTNALHFDSQPDTRWKSSLGTARNEKAIHDLQIAETQYKLGAANQIKAEGATSAAIARLQADNSPLDIVNSLLSQANLAVQLEIDGAELRAIQGGASYSYARMSDGERSALVFAAEVVAAKPGTVFLIDEPELHLHPSIVVELIKALILERPDCGFVICTHQLELPTAVGSGAIVLVRNCVWQKGAAVSWDIDLIHNSAQIPEWLWVDVMGARRKILFVEGNNRTSLDQPLYALLFPKVSVRPLESCKDVIRAVEGLRAVEEIHRATVFGLIDHDGMTDEQVKKFETNGIYPLPLFAVESLVYSEEAQLAVAVLQAETLGTDVQKILAEAKNAALESIKGKEKKEHLAARLAERQMRDQLLLAIPKRQQLIDGNTGDLNIVIRSPYPDELARLTAMADTYDIHGIISKYPVRESGILDGIAKGLHFNNRNDFEKAVLRRVGVDAQLRDSLKKRLGKLAPQLE